MGVHDRRSGGLLGVLGTLARRAVHANLVVSLAATSVAATTALLVDAPLDPLALVVVFAAARGVPCVEFLALPLLAVGVYSGLRAKRVFLAKNLLVGAAWAAVPLGVGAHARRLGDPNVWLLAAWVGAVVTVAAVVFDVKDVPGDRANGIDTIPVRYGPAAARQATAVANAVLALAVVALVASSVVPPRFLVLLALHAYVAGYVPFATPDRSALFYGLVVDGEHVALALVVMTLHGTGLL